LNDSKGRADILDRRVGRVPGLVETSATLERVALGGFPPPPSGGILPKRETKSAKPAQIRLFSGLASPVLLSVEAERDSCQRCFNFDYRRSDAMWKVIAMGLALSSVLAIALTGLGQEPAPPPGGGPPPPKAKGKNGAHGDELRKTYDLLRRVRSGVGNGRTEDRINDWIERATNLYRRAVRASEQGERWRARELGAAAHDLARAVDHAQSAARLDRPDPDLPPPPDGFGPEDVDERTRRDLSWAYERIRWSGSIEADADARFYLDAARDLYYAARRDVEAGRAERGGELARAAEAMTHVPEHLSNAAWGPGGSRARGGLDPAPPSEPKKKDRPRPRGDFDPGPDPKAKRGGPQDRLLPPPLF
jgi:hypothetical protein